MKKQKRITRMMELMRILEDPTASEIEKLSAERELQRIKVAVDKEESAAAGIPFDRYDDIRFLEKVSKDPSSTAWDKNLAIAGIEKIKKESKDVRSMRERLIKEVRAGNDQNVKDISNYVQKHAKYQ